VEEGENSRIENTVELSSRCSKAYRKLEKRADPRLVKAIRDSIDELRGNAELGKELSQDLKSMRSIRLDAFNYRIVYEVRERSPPVKIIIHTIAHRKNVYSEASRYLGAHAYAESDE